MEQTSGVAEEILRDVPLGAGDLLLIVSVSGRNAVPVEMCTIAQQRGTTVIALTNMTYSSSVSGRPLACAAFNTAFKVGARPLCSGAGNDDSR